ncbi:MAG: GNAT family N-acetyltransferase [Anaerolineae bacterium]|nr:GNAT family N-acetyltransferase [Anaerolineae bacterium]
MTHIRSLKTEDVEQVVSLWDAACIEAVGYPLGQEDAERIADNLRRTVDHDQAHCFVVENEGILVGFVTCAISTHPVMPGALGEVEDLYVQPEFRSGVQAELVRQAVLWLKRYPVDIIRTRVDTDEPETLTFWHSQKWEQNELIFNIYGCVPEDAQSQAVWDSYRLD